MLTLSIVWVALAATVIVVATIRKRSNHTQEDRSHSPESGKAIGVLAIAYGLVLLAGFVYVGWTHGLELIR